MRTDDNGLMDRISDLQRRMVKKPLSLYEQAWILQVAQSLVRQGDLLCNQAIGQIDQFRYIIRESGANYPGEEGKDNEDSS